MVTKKVCTLGIITFLFFLGASSVFGQEQPAQIPVTTPEMQNMVAEEGLVSDSKESETQWLYGDVINLDPQNKTILVKTLDYETDQEKEVAIATDEKTTFENIKSLDEIKPNDTVSVDYVVSPDGNNLAKNISLERPDAQPVPQAVEQPESQPTLKLEAPGMSQSDNSAIGY